MLITGSVHSVVRVSSDFTNEVGQVLPRPRRGTAGYVVLPWSLYGKKVCKSASVYALKTSLKLIQNILDAVGSDAPLIFDTSSRESNRTDTGTKATLVKLSLSGIADLRGNQSPSAVRKSKKDPRRRMSADGHPERRLVQRVYRGSG